MADETRSESPEEVEAPDAEPTPTEPEPDADDTGTDGEDALEDAAPADVVPEVDPDAPQPPQTEREAEKRQKAWDSERDRHMEKAKAADDYRYSLSVICPLCEGHGLMYEPQTPEEGAQMRGFLLSLVGETTPEELHAHPSFHRCDTCDGYGKVATGSRVSGQEALNCPDCNGQGHSGGRSAVVPIAAAPPTATQTPTVDASEQERIGNDAWGRPPGHPHYGLLPAQVS